MSSTEVLELDALMAVPARLTKRTPMPAKTKTKTKTKEPDSVAAAFELHAGAVWRVLKRLGVAERNLEDATQDVFIVAHQRWKTFRGEATRKSWLMGIALRVAKSHRYRQRRAGEQPGMRADAASGELVTQVDDTQTPYEWTQSREAGARLQTLLDALSETERALVILVHLEDLTAVEAAATVGVSPRRAYFQLEKARLVLSAAYARLERREQDSLGDQRSPSPQQDPTT